MKEWKHRVRVRLVFDSSQQLVRAVEVDGATVAEAIAQMNAWDSTGVRVPAVIVPAAAGELEEAGRTLARGAGGVLAERLVLSLPEADLEDCRGAAEALRASTGAHVAIVGAEGGSDAAFDYLLDYPADMLELGSGLSARAADPDGGELLSEVCAIAHELGWLVGADGISDGARRGACAGSGVDMVSGPAFGPAVPAPDLPALMASRQVAFDPRPLPRRQPVPGAAARPAARPAAATSSGGWASAGGLEPPRSREGPVASPPAVGLATVVGVCLLIVVVALLLFLLL